MKNLIYAFFALYFALCAITGCNRDSESMPGQQPVSGVISAQSHDALADAETDGLTDIPSKAGKNASLTYTIEAWTRGSYPRCVLHRTATGSLSEGVSFEIALVPGNYDLLFWADYGHGDYITADLRQVTLATLPYTPNDERDAFACALTDITWDGGAHFEAILTRPLAQLIVQNSQTFNESQAVKIEYHGLCTRYDVLTGKASAPQSNTTITFPNTSVGSAHVCKDFLFAPSDEQDISLSLFVGNTVKDLQTVQLQANYKTRITASFE